MKLKLAALAAAAAIGLGACTTVVHVPVRPSPAPSSQAPSSQQPSQAPSSQQPSQQQQVQGGQPQGQGQPLQQPTVAGVVKPSTIGVGQDGNQITGITWLSWGDSQAAVGATGTGEQGPSFGACNAVGNDPSNPACQPVSVTIDLSDEVNGQYQQITETSNADSYFGPAGTSINAQYGPSVSTFIQSAS